MPRRERPQNTTRSEHWIRVAVNEHPDSLSRRVAGTFHWAEQDKIEWLSPLRSDDYAEYYDQAFLERLGLRNLRIPLRAFWPSRGPRWDALGRTRTGKLLLVEAKAYIEEAVDYRSRAKDPASLEKISCALAAAKLAFRGSIDASWETPFYQYANRLSHLYYLRHLNQIDAYLLFVYFADAPDVPNPCTIQQWEGAERLIGKCLGLSVNHPFAEYVRSLAWSVPEMLGGNSDHAPPE